MIIINIVTLTLLLFTEARENIKQVNVHRYINKKVSGRHENKIRKYLSISYKIFTLS